MSTLRAVMRVASMAVRFVAGVTVLRRLVNAVSPAAPVRSTQTPSASISVVIPARNEARRIGPLLDAIARAPDVAEVIVVDDESTDDTCVIARRAGATVLTGAPLPDGWAGKAWALQQGLSAAQSDWVVTLDADVEDEQAKEILAQVKVVLEAAKVLRVATAETAVKPEATVTHWRNIIRDIPQ